MKILLILYGIGRGLEETQQSTLNYIVKPLENLGHNIKITYIRKKLSYPTNPQNNNNGIISETVVTPFNSDLYIELPEDELNDEDLYNYSRSFIDIHNDSYISNKNFISQLCNLNISTKYENFNDYDRIILCRDDIKFLGRSIMWERILGVAKFFPVTSKWFWNAGIGERFYVCNSHDGMLLAQRKKLAKESIKYYGYLNGEKLAKFTFNKYKLNIGCTNIAFQRIRSANVNVNERFFYTIWRPYEVVRVIISEIKFYFTYIILCKFI